MKKIKDMLRRIGTAGLAAIMLTAQMPMTAFAEEIAQPQEIVVSDDVLPAKVQTDDVLPGESGGGIIEGTASEESDEDILNASETDDEVVQAGAAPLAEQEASEVTADEESSDTVEKQEEGADEQKAQESDKKDVDGDKESEGQTASMEEERPAFRASRSIDGVKITVEAEKGVFPEGAVLSVEKVTAAEERKAEEAVEAERPEDSQVAVSYTYDIKVLDKDGNEIQPADETRVKVSFTLEEVADGNLTTNVYHIVEGDPQNGGDSGEAAPKEGDNPENGRNEEADAVNSAELTAEKLEVETDGDTAMVETDGFSLYTVEFTYNSMQYVLPGDSEVVLSDILEAVGLSGKASAVEVSKSSLFSAEKNEGGEWIVTAHKAFGTKEWMKVLIGGVKYEITVMDDQEVGSWAELQAQFDSASTEENNPTLITLSGDVTAGEGDSALVIQTDKYVTLDLAGHTIDRGLAGEDKNPAENGSVITVSGNLTLSDGSAAQTGKITGGNTTGNGGGVYVDEGGKFTMEGGTITGCKASSNGGGVYVYINGTFTMENGTISHCTANESGGGVHVFENGTFRVSGAPVISGNMTVDSANNVALGYRTTITVFNELTSGAKIYVYAGNKDPVATAGEAYTLKASDMDAFHSDGDGRLVAALDSDGKVKFFTPWGALQAKLTNASEVEGNPTQIKLSGNLTADTRDNALWIPGGTYVTLDLNGYTIDRGLTNQANNGNVITVEGHLTISDNSTAHTGTITGGNNTGNGGGVYVRESGEFTMKGGTISGCNVTGNNSKGGGVYVDNNGKFTMSGGTITGCNASENGGGVYVGNNGEFTMSGGTITGCKAGWGGGVFVYEGKFTMEDGIISNCNTDNGGYGGGVYVGNNGEFTMKGGTITSCNAPLNGGGVCVDSNGTFTMEGGTISGCIVNGLGCKGGGVYVANGKFIIKSGTISGCSAGDGGGVYVASDGTFTMDGGTISGCNATGKDSSSGGGVYVNSGGTFTMENGTISGCEAINGGGVCVEDGTFTMSGAPLIKDNSANNSANNVALNYGTIITVTGALTTGAEIWVNADKGVAFAKKEGSYSITDTDLTKFHSDADSSLVAAEDSDGSVKFFTPWGALQAKFNNASTVAGSPTRITLTGNVTASGNETALVIPEDRYVTLDLNGNTIDRGLAVQPVDNNDNVITVSGNLTLTDSSSAQTGKITGGNNGQASGGGVYVKGGTFTMDGGTISGCNAALGGGVNVDSGTFTMTGGTITGCNAYDSGGGVCVNGSFTMTGGTITDCNATSGGGRGGGVYVDSGTFTMTGGKITGCKAKNSGGGVYNHGTFNMSDGTITNCSATGDESNGGGVYIEYGGTFKVSGTPVISGNMKGSTSANNVELGGKTISVNGALTSGAEIHVNAGKGDVVATGENYTLQASDADAFRSDRPSSLTAALDSDGTVKFFTPWGALQAKFNNASTVAGSPTQITLTGDVTAGEGDTALVIPAGKYVTLDLSGNTINRGLANKSAKDNGNVITVKGTLILKDSSTGHTGTLTGGNTTGNGGGVFVNEGGTFTMSDGTISGCNANGYSGGVFVNKGGTFTMNGGTITGCTVAGHYNTYGGGVFNYGTFAMSGGTITNCSAKQGGGVYVEGDGSDEGGKFTMNGGTINGCNATSDGGGVYVGGGNGTFTMTDGTITDCNATSDGGGVYVEGGNKFTMENGTITGCKANNSGGGVYVHGDSFTMDGGTITGCSATNGGGVYVLKDMFTMSGGTISGCTATNHGGGVYVAGYEDIRGTFNMSGGTITGCSATNGGGVFAGMLCTFTMSGAPVIRDNKKDGNANNVVLDGGKTISVNGALEPGAEIHINAGKGTTVAEKGGSRTASLTETEAGYFKSDVSSDLLGWLNDAGQVVLKAPLPALTGAADLTYNGTEQTPALTFFGDPAPALTAGTDYTVSYKKVNGSTETVINRVPKDAGDYKAVVTGTGSYTGTSEASFTIAPKTVKVSSGIAANDKTYDRTTDAELITTNAVFTGICDGDSLTVSGTGSFEDSSAGSGKTVTIDLSSLTLGGTSSANYVLASDGNQSETTATINKKKLTITGVTAADKEYDGNTSATTDTTNAVVTGLVDGDSVEFMVSGSFADANKGENKTVTLSDWTLTSGGNNYEIDADKSQKTTTAGITVMQVYITGIIAENKEYNGNKTATVSGAAVLKNVKDDNIISDLSVSNITAEFADKNVGDGKAVSITGGTLDSDNYTLIPGKTTGLTANITPKQVIITGLSAKDKVYDTTTAATTIGTAVIDGKIGNDDVTVSAGTAAFDNANVSDNKTVTFADYSLTGKDASNYTLSAQPANVTANITKATPTITSNPEADAISYGQTLADSMLNGGDAICNGSEVYGTFAWSNMSTKPAVSDSDKTEYTVTFTPVDTTNLNQTTCKVKLTVNKADITADQITPPAKIEDLKYTEQALPLISAGSVPGNIGTMQYTLGSESAATEPYTTAIPTATDAGTYYVWYKVIGDANHNDYVSETPVSVTIAKVEYTGTKTASATVRSGQTTSSKTVALPALPEGASYAATGTAGGDTAALIDGTPSVEGTTLTFSTTSQDDQTTATITIPVTGATNYEDYDVIVTVTAKAKDETVVTITGIPPIAIEYGDTIVLSGSVQNPGTNGTWTWTSSDSEVLRITPDGANATIEMMKVGTATITASYESDTTLGEAQSSLTVSPKQLGINWKNTSFTYDGTSHIPIATLSGVKSGDTCTVSVTGAQINAGSHTATASLTGTDTGNYTLPEDKKTCGFTISKANISSAAVTLGAALIYTGSEQTQSVAKVELSGRTINSSDYTVTNNSGRNAGSYTLTVTAKADSNYTGSVSKTFTIAKKAITPTVTVTGSYSYTGSAITPDYTVKNGSTIMAASEYTISLSDNINAGEGKLTITAAAGGNYSFEPVTVAFVIAKAAHEDVQVSGKAKYGSRGTVALDSYIEAGGSIGTISVSDNSSVLSGEPSISGTTLSYNFADIAENFGKTAVVTVPVKDSTNYHDYAILIRLTVDCPHENTEIRNDKTATCTEQGYTGDRYCKDCGTLVQSGEVIPIDPNNHAYDDGVITTQPTIFAEGVKTYTCTRCHHTYTEVIPKVDDGEDHSDLIEDIKDLSGNNVPKVEAIKDETGKEIGKQILIGGEEVEKTVTDAEGNETVQTSIWIGGLESSYRYTGSAIKPSFNVYDGTKKLSSGTDYSVSYKNNKNAGDTATITISFKGNYKGTAQEKISFSITPAVLGADVEATDVTTYATGKTLRPVPVMKWASTGKSIDKKNFSFTYKDSADTVIDGIKEAGQYKVVITSKNGSFTGETEAAITVTGSKKLLLSGATVKLSPNKYTYTGDPITPAVGSYTLKLNGKTLTEGTDYYVSDIRNNTNPGKATIVFTAKDGNQAGYIGEKTATFTISKGRALKDGEGFTYSYSESVPYAKGGAKPTVVVKDGDDTLKAGIDYTVSYSRNTKVTNGATAVITITGKGNHKGSVKKYFTITAQDIERLKDGISVADKTESRKGYKNPTVTIIDLDGKKLKAGTDYVIDGASYSEPDENGVVMAKINGKGNYTGTASITYRYIKAAQNLSKTKVMKKIADKTYTGREVRLTDSDLTGILYTGNKKTHTYLIPGTDFVVLRYSNNTKAGTAKVTIKGIGSYGGTKTLTFKIRQKKGDYKGALVGGDWTKVQ